MKKPSAVTKPGQYVFLCVPEIALYEWHPFTLTSSPYEDFLSVHIRVVGDWTSAFGRRLGCQVNLKGPGGSAVTKNNETDVVSLPATLPLVMIDGPYGTSSEDVFDYEVSVLVGAGIGVTPFASILKTIWYRINNPMSSDNLKKVYFIWVCRDKDVC